jgi:hypothetical protein
MPIHYCLGLEHSGVARSVDPKGLEIKELRKQLKLLVPQLSFEEVIDVPSFAWTDQQQTTHILTRLTFDDHAQIDRYRDELAKGLAGAKDLGGYGFGPDPPLFALDAWSTNGRDGGIFADRQRAERLTNTTGGLRDRSGDPVTGRGVNVVIVDRGLERAEVQQIAARMAARNGVDAGPAKETLGWSRYEWDLTTPPSLRLYRPPGQQGSEHAHMIARNVLAIAPGATIWDAPLLPSDDEPDAPPGPSSACQLFHEIRAAVRAGKIVSRDFATGKLVERSFKRPVVVVNAWGVMDPETDPRFAEFADNPRNFLVNDMQRLDDAGIDVIFAAGNCGEPCPDPRCGEAERGPGCSIYGLNAHPAVLSVGAVRADGLPLALSAQGPGRLAARLGRDDVDYGRALYKPDLCAPSHFRESDDAAETNTGTSAACGFAGGIVAALRGIDPLLSPARLRSILRATAQPLGGKEWDPRLGYGVIDGAAALAMTENLNR